MNISDRAGVKDLIVDTVTDAFAAADDDNAESFDLSTVTVHYGDPGDEITDSYVAFGVIEGQADPAVFGPVGSDDEYTIVCGIRHIGGDTEAEANRRAQLILNLLNVTLFQSAFAQATYNARVFPAKQDGPNGAGPLDGQEAVSEVDLIIGVSVPVRGA